MPDVERHRQCFVRQRYHVHIAPGGIDNFIIQQADPRICGKARCDQCINGIAHRGHQGTQLIVDLALYCSHAQHPDAGRYYQPDEKVHPQEYQ